MTPDLSNMIDFANEIFKTFLPIFGPILGITLGLGLLSVIRNEIRKGIDDPEVRDHQIRQAKRVRLIEELEQLDWIEKPKNAEPTEAPAREVVGIGDDGEMVFEGDEEPRYMRRIQ